MQEHLYANAVSYKGAGLLLVGPSGVGKSDLTLRLMAAGGQLVADDQVKLHANASGQLCASPHQGWAGLMEIRGQGIIRVPYLPSTIIDFYIALHHGPEHERLPKAESCFLCGLSLPVFHLNAMLASAPVRLDCMIASWRQPKALQAEQGGHDG
jgi:HPr kinase/phosphorylase